jgi:hypothetical protein
MRRLATSTRAARRGLAMIAVLLVLMALFVLSAPFLVTVRNADQASSEAADRSVLRLTLDAAGRHAAAKLGASHPALDETPYHDDEAELGVTASFPEGFLATADPHQVMWGLEALDVAARIDLASAPPQVFANVIGGAARLTAECKEKDRVLELSSTEGFLPEGVVLLDNEWLGFAGVEGQKLLQLQRGLLVKLDAEGKASECGPTPPLPHEIGAFVLDQRAFALCEWRTAQDLAGGRLRAYESIEELREAEEFMLGPGLGRDAYLALARTTSAFAHERAGSVWQRPARVVGEPGGEPQYGCKLPVDDARWFNPGTTVWITDGTNSEYGMVRTSEAGTLILFEPLRSPYRPYETLVHPLARTPVNVNTATPEVLKALWTNLKLRGKSARLTGGEVERLVDLALVSRPFTGFEDLLRRLVLPAAGLAELPEDAPIRPEALEELAREAKLDASGKKVLVGFIDPDDARAFYKNSRNANDGELEFSTLPLCFTSRDVYELELRAAVNAPSGTDRARGERQLVELFVPQRDLLTVWTRQEDFDEAPRLDRAAAGWLTGPSPTARHDPLFGDTSSLRWPTRTRAHLGPHDTLRLPTDDATTVPYTFAVRADEDGWAQLAAVRENAEARGATYALHFDDESKELEGRFLPDEPEPLDLAELGWSGAGNRMSGMATSLWIKPRALEEGARLIDIGGTLDDTDRASLLFEEGKLVLRVLDGAGDHPTSEFKEQAEVHYPLSGEGPGLPLDTWSHVEIAVDGNRPDQMALWVDGRRSAHTPGLTRLSAALPSQSDTIRVESTEGFPDKCVLRIGNELIEAIKQSDKAFLAKFQATGESAGFGGRLAREQHAGYPETNSGLFKYTDHPAGTTVQLYGYSTPIFSNVPNVAANLRDELGLFAVARVEGTVVSGSEKRETSMEAITLQGDPVAIGHGFSARADGLEGLLLAPVDPGRSLEDTMGAFNSEGGYAAILAPLYGDGSGQDGMYQQDINGARINGIEVVRYSGYEGQTLKIVARGGAGLAKLEGDIDNAVEARGSFIVYYALPPGWTYTGSPSLEERNMLLSYQVMVIPISIPAAGGSGVTGFEQGNNGSAFVQLTHAGGESGLTEWVRYDEISSDGFFVRDGPRALINAFNALQFGDVPLDDPSRQQNSLDPAIVVARPAPKRFVAATPQPEPSSRQKGGGSYWDYLMGEPEDVDFPVARAVNSQFQFRGVLGTFQHAHPSGTLVLPVFRLRQFDETSGWPGRFDHVMFMSEEPTEPGFPGVVHHAHRPNEYLAYYWREGGEPLSAEAAENPTAEPQSGFQTSLTHVALDDRLAVPFAPTPTNDANGVPFDSRLLARLVLYPSGELPREVSKGQLGGDAVAKASLGLRTGGTVPSLTVDEALFFPSELGSMSGMPVQLVVAQPFGEGDNSFTALKETVRTPLGDYVLDKPTLPGQAGGSGSNNNAVPDVMGEVLTNLPEVGGVLRIGDEILCYERFESSGNAYTFTLPPAGRGLLGTTSQPHQPTESISYLGAFPAAILALDAKADAARLQLVEVPANFPAQGLVRVEDELVHYTRIENGALAMPRASEEPGLMDEKGPGLFRGRFGTERADHPAGSPVILFPFRYWDGWSDQAEAPELTYYTLSSEQPDAYWRRVFWKADPGGHPGPALGVLQRTNPETPWDAAPEGDNGLTLLWEGKIDGEGNPINRQTDRIEWRVFVRHLPGSFDPRDGLAHGWKTSPRLELFGVEFMGPNRTFARVDR